MSTPLRLIKLLTKKISGFSITDICFTLTIFVQSRPAGTMNILDLVHLLISSFTVNASTII